MRQLLTRLQLTMTVEVLNVEGPCRYSHCQLVPCEQLPHLVYCISFLFDYSKNIFLFILTSYRMLRNPAGRAGLPVHTQASDVYVFSAHLQYAHASMLLYTFMREIQKCGNVILGTRWN